MREKPWAERQKTSRLLVGPGFYTSGAGTITNLLQEPCGGVGIICSKAGSVRANHFHKTDWHFLYVLSGKMRYTHIGPQGRLEFLVPQGQMVFTPPREPHALEFLEDTVMVSMSKLPRDHKSHEADVVRLEVPLV